MKNRIKFLSIIICLQLLAKNVLSEPFVVLEYRNKNVQSLENSDNPFLNNQNFSKKHKVKKNETLSDIIFKNYGVEHFNIDILSLSIVIWCAVGGRQSLMGSFLGAIIITAGQGFLSESETFLHTWTLVMGLVFILTVLFLPKGLAGAFEKFTK